VPHEPKAVPGGDLRIGLTAEYEREIEESDVLGFAANSGDFNPLHVDSDFAQNSRFGQRIVPRSMSRVGYESAARLQRGTFPLVQVAFGLQ
jgi:acyl dehydratase